jgi:hypothetical protein
LRGELVDPVLFELYNLCIALVIFITFSILSLLILESLFGCHEGFFRITESRVQSLWNLVPPSSGIHAMVVTLSEGFEPKSLI